MLEFKTYLKRTKTEATEPPAEATPATPSGQNAEQLLLQIRKDLEGIRAAIPSEVQALMMQLSRELVPGPDNHFKRGWWDSVKNWWSNMWRGKYNPNNPYYWTNRFGELGRRANESIEDYTLSLTEYRMLNQAVVQLEAEVSGMPSIKLKDILQKWSAELERRLDGYIANAIANVDALMAVHPHGPLSPSPRPSGDPGVDDSTGEMPDDERSAAARRPLDESVIERLMMKLTKPASFGRNLTLDADELATIQEIRQQAREKLAKALRNPTLKRQWAKYQAWKKSRGGFLATPIKGDSSLSDVVIGKSSITLPPEVHDMAEAERALASLKTLGTNPSRGDAQIAGKHLQRLLDYLHSEPMADDEDEDDEHHSGDPEDIAAGADETDDDDDDDDDPSSGGIPRDDGGAPKPKKDRSAGTGGKVHAIGDIHGMYKEMIDELKHTGYVDDSENWAGGDAILAFTGDLTDRGPDGYKVVKKIMELQDQAKKAGGEVIVTLGNHDIYAFMLARLIRMGAEDPSTPVTDRKYDLLKEFSARKGAMTDPAQTLQQAKEAIEAVKAKTDPSKHNLLDQLLENLEHQIIKNRMPGKDLVDIAEDRDMVIWGCSLPAIVKRRGILFQHVNGHGTYKKLLNMAGKPKFNPDPTDPSIGEMGFHDDDDPYDKDKHGNATARINDLVHRMMMGGSSAHLSALYNLFTGDDSRSWEHGYGSGISPSTNKEVDDHLATFGDGAHMIAHGHTQHDRKEPIKYSNGRVVNLDTGLAYGNKKGEVGRMYDFTPHAKDDSPDEPDEPDDEGDDAGETEEERMRREIKITGETPEEWKRRQIILGSDPEDGDMPRDNGDPGDGDGVDPDTDTTGGPAPKRPRRSGPVPEEEKEYPEFRPGVPKKLPGEHQDAFIIRLKAWVNAAWKHFAKHKQVRRDGTLKLGSKFKGEHISNWEKTDLFHYVLTGLKPGESPDDDTDTGGPDDGDTSGGGEGDDKSTGPIPRTDPVPSRPTEGLHPLWHGDEVTDDWRDLVHERNLEPTRSKLKKAIKLKKTSELPREPELQAAHDAVWHPWHNREGMKPILNRMGGGAPSNRTSVIPYPLPYVLRRSGKDPHTGKTFADLGIKEDPRIAIIERYYPDVYKDLVSKGRIEMPGDDPEEIERRILHLRATGKDKSDKRRTTIEKRSGETRKKEILEKIDQLKTNPKFVEMFGGDLDEVDVNIDQLKRDVEAGDLDEVEELFKHLGASPDELKEHTIVDKYKHYLRMGLKALPRNLTEAPLSERYKYFKGMLTEQASE